jgi:hypothetical protein
VGMILTSLVRPALARRLDALPVEPLPAGHSPAGPAVNGSQPDPTPVGSTPNGSAANGSQPADSTPAVSASSTPAGFASPTGSAATGSAPSDLEPEDAELSEPGQVRTLLASHGDAEPDSAPATAAVIPAGPSQRRPLLDLSRLRRPPAAAVLATAVVVVIGAVQAGSDLRADSATSREVLPRPVAAAGTWLQQHNTGGTIISTPDLNRGLTNRAILAMGGYTGLQSYPEARIEHPRSLPTGGRRPLLDSRQVLLDPASCRSGQILVNQDVRYIVLYKFTNEANYDAFTGDPQRYRPVFQDRSMIIYAAQHGTAPGC